MKDCDNVRKAEVSSNEIPQASSSKLQKRPKVKCGKTSISIKIGNKTIDLTKVSNLPNDRQFREAWQFEGDAIEIDLGVARSIKREHLRQERSPILRELDIEWMRASEHGDQVAMTEIALLKQRYRDVTNHAAIDDAKSVESLASINLASLVK